MLTGKGMRVRALSHQAHLEVLSESSQVVGPAACPEVPEGSASTVMGEKSASL